MLETQTIIIGDSLINDFMSPEKRFRDVKVHMGRREVDRLMGEGETYGDGPIPAYLQEALHAKRGGADIHMLFLNDSHDPSDSRQQVELLRFGSHAVEGTEGAEFVSPIKDIVSHAEVINTSTLAMPVRLFHEKMEQIIGKDVLKLTLEEREKYVFVLLGGYSNIRVLGTANKIRNEYEFPNVYVCPHLVGSRDYQAHMTALQEGFPNALICVIPSLRQIAEMSGIRRAVHNMDLYGSCVIDPIEEAGKFNTDQRNIVENLYG